MTGATTTGGRSMSKGKKPDYYEPDNEYGYVRTPTMLSCAVDDTAITDSLLRYLVAIGSYSTRRNGNWCWPSRRKIAERMGVSPRAVTRAMATLADLGYIEIRPRFANDEEQGEDKRGKQVSNYYRVLLDFELPPSRDRSLQARPRAGIGGRPKYSAFFDDTPGTPAVPPPLELESSMAPGTPAVPPPLELESSMAPGTPEFQQNLESEDRNGNWKGRPAGAGVISPRDENQDAEADPDADPDADPSQLRGAPPAPSAPLTPDYATWLTTLIPIGEYEQYLLRPDRGAYEYRRWCWERGLEPVR